MRCGYYKLPGEPSFFPYAGPAWNFHKALAVYPRTNFFFEQWKPHIEQHLFSLHRYSWRSFLDCYIEQRENPQWLQKKHPESGIRKLPHSGQIFILLFSRFIWASNNHYICILYECIVIISTIFLPFFKKILERWIDWSMVKSDYDRITRGYLTACVGWIFLMRFNGVRQIPCSFIDWLHLGWAKGRM